MFGQQTLAEAFGNSPIALCLKMHINHLAIVIHSAPQVVLLLAVVFDEDFVDVRGFSIASMFSLRSARVKSAQLYAPKGMDSRVTMIPRSASRCLKTQ